jgi:hypothetical protein
MLRKSQKIDITVDLDANIKNMTNNELAMYLVLVEESVNISVKQGNYTLMSRLINYKLAIDKMLEERLKQKLT